MFRYHAIGEKERSRPILSGFSQDENLCFVQEHFIHLIREGRRIARGEFYCGVADHFSQAADIGSDDQATTEHLLDGGEAGGLFPDRGHDDNIERVYFGGEFFAAEETGDAGVVAGVSALDQFLDLRALWAIADENDFEVLALRAEAMSGFDQNGNAFFRDEAADTAEADFSGFRGCSRPGFGGLRRVTLQAVIDDDRARQGDSLRGEMRDRNIRRGTFCKEVARNVPRYF